ncbi:MAG: beta-ketoacyl synthase N-terminal-like domain-containing protein [Myxococcota bacterium]
MARVGIYGWGIVAPRSPDVEAFASNLESAQSWLTPFDGFGPSTFLAGEPAFDFQDYKGWIDERFPPNKFPQLDQKMGEMIQFSLGAFIQALGQNPGLEQTLQELGAETHILIGTGVGQLPTSYDCSIQLYRAQRRWDRFWADASRNSDRNTYEGLNPEGRDELRERWHVPADPRELDADLEDLDLLEGEWNACWMRRSDGLAEYLEAFDEIESEGVEGDIEREKLSLIRRKRAALERLHSKWDCPTPPWLSVSTALLWNIANIPAAQISIIGGLTGPAYAPVAACSTFGVGLDLGLRAIHSGVARAVVVGATDPAPHPLLVGAFYNARVLAAASRPSVPMSDLRGTHVAGGACVWILGDHEYMSARGYRPLGLEILGVGVTSDADHIITPSEAGPQEAIRRALQSAGIEDTSELGTWDLHATGTPGDYREVANLKEILPDTVAVSARKGTFGHGMAASGGWELTAQHLGLSAGHIYPSPLRQENLNAEIGSVPFRYVLDIAVPDPGGAAGKLSMGIGGINACVISRRWS